jgi:hypothetical protein
MDEFFVRNLSGLKVIALLYFQHMAVETVHISLEQEVSEKWFEQPPKEGLSRILYRHHPEILPIVVADIPPTSLFKHDTGFQVIGNFHLEISDTQGKYNQLRTFLRGYPGLIIPDDSPVRELPDIQYEINPPSDMARVGIQLSSEEREYVIDLEKKVRKYPTLRDLSKNLLAWYKSPTVIGDIPRAQLTQARGGGLQESLHAYHPRKILGLSSNTLFDNNISPDPKASGYAVFFAVQEMHRRQ